MVLDDLRLRSSGQWIELVQNVQKALLQAKVISAELQGEAVREFKEQVREVMWELLVRGVLVFGSDSYNPNFPHYRLTERGVREVMDTGPQPHDPVGFLKLLRSKAPGLDPVIDGYVVEAVTTFNAGCLRASAVMLGCASEALIGVLGSELANRHPEPRHREAIQKSQDALSINRRFTAIRLALDALPWKGDHSDTVARHLPGIFDLVRQQRNDAGHPSIDKRPDEIQREEVFVSLRLFVEYARRVLELIGALP